MSGQASDIEPISPVEAGPLEAVIFDVDGTLADTERHGHRVAFNQAFAEAGLPYEWDPEGYGVLLERPGGEGRIARYLANEGHEEGAAASLARALHRRKQEHFLALVRAGAVPPRPGMIRLIDELSAAGVRLGVATTGQQVWVIELLRTLFGPVRTRAFGAVVTSEDVDVHKPDPAAYRIALERLGCPPAHAVAVEDSAVGLRAAKAGGLACLVVRNAYTHGHDFTGADLVVDGLGSGEAEPGSEEYEEAEVVANPHGIHVEPAIGVATLRDLVRATAAAAA